MKKILLLFMTIIFLLIFAGCNDNITDDIENKISGYKGVSAIITEIQHESKGLLVKGLGNADILGLDEECYVNCESAYFVYANYDTSEVIELEFYDFIIGDEITFDVESIENKYAVISRVQLSTQRK
jgi:hypothetical protein